MYKNGVLHILFKTKIQMEEEYDSNSSKDSIEMNDESMLIQQIINKTVITGSDAAVKDKSIAGKWIITTVYNKKVNEGEITSQS